MKKNTKKLIQILFVAAFSSTAFLSCQKAAPAPYGSPGSELPKTITPPTFSAELNGSFSATSFTPIKTVQGGYVILKGVSTYNTITISFPVTLGTGHYWIGSNNVRLTVTNGGITYVDDANVSNSGSFEVTSINQGKYTATFSCFASDSTNTFNSISVSQGSITNM